MVRTCEMCFRRIGFRQGVVTPEGKRVCASCAKQGGSETLVVTPDDLKPGDVLASGSVVIGYDAIVRGGARYMVRKSDGTEGTVVFDRRRKVEVTRTASRKVAHDAGAPQEVRHCPFCGSGDVVGRSDGSIECGYCNQVCTIKVEPQYPNMPQTDPVTGQPMIPQDPAKPPSADPAAQSAPPPPAGKPPFPPKKDGPPAGDKPEPKGDSPFPPKKDDGGDKKPDDGKKKPPPFAKQQARRRVAAKSVCAECGRPITYIAPPADEGPDARGDWMHDDEFQVWGTANEYDHGAVPSERTASRIPAPFGGTFITREGVAVSEDEYVDLLAKQFGA